MVVTFCLLGSTRTALPNIPIYTLLQPFLASKWTSRPTCGSFKPCPDPEVLALKIGGLSVLRFSRERVMCKRTNTQTNTWKYLLDIDRYQVNAMKIDDLWPWPLIFWPTDFDRLLVGDYLSPRWSSFVKIRLKFRPVADWHPDKQTEGKSLIEWHLAKRNGTR